MKQRLLGLVLLVFCATGAFAQDEPPKKLDPISGAVVPAGPAVDKAGTPASDPSGNVLALVREAVRRLDDLRVAEKELADTKNANLREIIELRAIHQRDLRKAESDRLDSIRQVDREDVNKTAASAQLAIATLAKAATDTAETLRAQVASVAAAAAAQRATDTGEINKRVSNVELSLSQGTGKSAGINATFVAIVAIGGLLLTGIGLIYRSSTRNGAYARKNNGP